jgi:polyketide cyclase/dehydrase/lipid transport protein
MLVCRHQTFIGAPVRSVWELVGRPSRHPEWWPSVVEVQGQRFGRGCSYCQISQEDEGATETTLVVERLEELKELLVRCEKNGLYMRWLLTEAQGGTFVDAEFGLDPDRAPDAAEQLEEAAIKHQLRSWLWTSLDGLADAASTSPPAGGDVTLDGRLE